MPWIQGFVSLRLDGTLETIVAVLFVDHLLACCFVYHQESVMMSEEVVVAKLQRYSK
jgi:hypothetical protein